MRFGMWKEKQIEEIDSDFHNRRQFLGRMNFKDNDLLEHFSAIILKFESFYENFLSPWKIAKLF